MSDEALIIEGIVKPHSRTIAAAVKAAAVSSGHKKTGAMIRKMRPKIRKDGEDIWGISVSMPRYAFILHNGVKSQTVERGGAVYKTSGFRGSGFISEALNQTVPKLADDLMRASSDLSVKTMNF